MKNIFNAELLTLAEQVLEARRDNFDVLLDVAGLNPRTDLVGQDLRSADFYDCDLDSYNFSNSDLRNASFVGAKNVLKANFKDANLKGASFDINPNEAVSAYLKRVVELWRGDRALAATIVSRALYHAERKDWHAFTHHVKHFADRAPPFFTLNLLLSTVWIESAPEFWVRLLSGSAEPFLPKNAWEVPGDVQSLFGNATMKVTRDAAQNVTDSILSISTEDGMARFLLKRAEARLPNAFSLDQVRKLFSDASEAYFQ